VQTELFLTFPPPTISSITLIPLQREDTAGRFRVWLTISGSTSPELLWDRKIEGGFPELKILAGFSSSPRSFPHLKHRNKRFGIVSNLENPSATPINRLETPSILPVI